LQEGAGSSGPYFHATTASVAAAPGLGVFNVTGSNLGRDGAVAGSSIGDQVRSSARFHLKDDSQSTGNPPFPWLLPLDGQGAHH